MVPVFSLYLMPQRYISFVLLMSPILGIVLGPLLGQRSDNCSLRLGRRRPFLLIFGVLALVGFGGFTWAHRLAAVLSPAHQHLLTLILAVLFFFCMDWGCDSLNMPARALIADLVPSAYQDKASSLFSAMASVGAMSGYLLGAFSIVALAPWLGTDVQLLFTLCSLVFAVALSVTIAFGKEQSLEEVEANATIANTAADSEPGVRELFLAMLHMPPALARCFIMGTSAWICGCSVMFFITDWCGRVLYAGLPGGTEHEILRYQTGVRFASLLFAGSSLVALLYSTALPRLMTHLSVELPYLVTQLFFGGALLFMHFFPSYGSMATVLVGFGLAYANQSTVPYAVAALIASDDETGLFTAVISTTIAAAQLTVSLAAGPIMQRLEVSSYLAGSGFFAIFAGLMALTLRTRDGRRIVFREVAGQPPPHKLRFMRQRSRRKSYVRHRAGVGDLASSVRHAAFASPELARRLPEDERSHIGYSSSVGIISSFTAIRPYDPPALATPDSDMSSCVNIQHA